MTAPFTDYGRVHRAEGEFVPCTPRDAAGVQAVLAGAHQARQPVRVRGGGHSMNGSAVPRAGEVLVSTAGLRHYRFEREGTVTVGAGAAVWDVDQLLRRHGFQLLLCNDGGAAAATVGGFVSAGGIGAETWRHGGFWETADEVLFVTGSGEVMLLRPGDDLFRWIFGAMGQLGVVVEATLRIVAVEGGDQSEPRYPAAEEGQVPASAPAWEHNLWFTLFAPEGLAEGMADGLAAVARRHCDLWLPRGGYAYFVRFHSFNPPLLYPAQESFVAVGVWGMVDVVDIGRLCRLERDIAALVAEEPRCRRYIQSELTMPDFDFAEYFGPAVYRGFEARKRECDPHFVLGRGSIFPSGLGYR